MAVRRSAKENRRFWPAWAGCDFEYFRGVVTLHSDWLIGNHRPALRPPDREATAVRRSEMGKVGFVHELHPLKLTSNVLWYSYDNDDNRRHT